MKAFVVCLTLALSSSPVLACAAEKIVFKDEFKSWDPTWGIPLDVEAVKNGAMVVRPMPDTNVAVLNQAGLFKNGELCGEVSIFAAGSLQDGIIGLIFWADDNANFYAVMISPDGRFALMRRQAGRTLLPISWQHTDAVKPGTGTWNELSARIRDTQVTISINGGQVAKLDKTYPPADGGMIGVFVESDGTQDAPVEGAVRNLSFAE